MTPPNEHPSEGGRDDRGVPYHAESTLSSAQVLKLEMESGLAYSERRLTRRRWFEAVRRRVHRTSPSTPTPAHLEHLECSRQPHIQGRGAQKRTQRAG